VKGQVPFRVKPAPEQLSLRQRLLTPGLVNIQHKWYTKRTGFKSGEKRYEYYSCKDNCRILQEGERALIFVLKNISEEMARHA